MKQSKVLRSMKSQILDCIICDKSRLNKKTATIHEGKKSFEIYVPRDLRIIFYEEGHMDFTSNLWYVSGFDFKQLSQLFLKKIASSAPLR